MTMSWRLRSFWVAYGVFTFFLAALWAGPVVETAVAPVRRPIAGETEIQDQHRDGGFVRFVWASRKMRLADSPGVDVTMDAGGDRFDLALYVDHSAPNEAPCTTIKPWARSQVVGIGDHHTRFCVEIPRSVTASDAISIKIVAKYRGLLGLWTLFVALPEIEA